MMQPTELAVGNRTLHRGTGGHELIAPLRDSGELESFVDTK